MEPRFPRADQSFHRRSRTGPAYGLPIAVHTRDAWLEPSPSCADSAAGAGASSTPIPDGIETCRKLRDWAISSSESRRGDLQKSRLAEVVRDMELREIVLETDCPYQRPPPGASATNRPTCATCAKKSRAEIKGADARGSGRRDGENAKQIFKESEVYMRSSSDHLPGGTIGMKADAVTGVTICLFSAIYDEFPSLKRLNVDLSTCTPCRP